MTEWRTIDSAPKSGAPILVWGLLVVLPKNEEIYIDLSRPARAVAAWDEIDQSWSLTGGTWEGPWIKPTHWMPLPSPPEGA